jgi:hypothetical protein
MSDNERNPVQTDQVALQDFANASPHTEQGSANGSVPSEMAAAPMPEHVQTEETDGVQANHWRTEAGRKGARRVHQLIQEGLLYEQEHGLKSGRQRLRQLIELGKVYEQEHGVQPDRPRKRRERLARMEREQLLATLLECLLRIAKPSFRAELEQLVAALRRAEKGHAA